MFEDRKYKRLKAVDEIFVFMIFVVNKLLWLVRHRRLKSSIGVDDIRFHED